MQRTIYGEEHEAFRETVGAFLRKEVAPRFSEWEQLGYPPKEFWQRAGELGLLGLQVPERYGGGGAESFKFNVVLSEEAQAAGVSLGGVRVHSDICMPYYLHYTTEEQRERWLPRLVSGDAVAAIAMSEPGTGSDLAGMSTTATRDGDSYVLNGQKTFITNGAVADLVIVAAKTDATKRREGISLFVVDAETEGFSRGRKLDKIGLPAQDTAELFFDDVRVPAENLLGEEGRGFEYLTSNLAQERLSIAINAQAAATNAVRHTLEYVQEREAFGTTIASFQNTKFELAACSTDVAAGQALADQAVEAHDRGELTAPDAAQVKLFCTEMQGRVVDRCLQLHGGYGYILEYPIARLYADARVTRIYGGSNEIMKVIIAKSLGL